MLTEITLKNFKCFKEKTHFPLSKINLLTGVNGRGKSTMLQVFLLFKQQWLNDELHLNGDYAELGMIEDVKNSETSTSTPIEIELIYGKHSAFHFYYATADFEKEKRQFQVDTHDRHLQMLSFKHQWGEPSQTLQASNSGSLMMLFPDSIHYISADRIGPKNFYRYANPDASRKIDKQGKSAPFVLSHQKNKVVSEKLCLGQDSETVLQQTEEWLNEIFDGAKVALKAERDTISMSYNTKHTPNRYKPSNVGFGYSYILPIIVSGLIARDGEILIVENPEAHLHPAAQSRLTKFLAKVASCGVQVFIETHSEHILNALRVVSVSKDYEIKNTDISVLYFQNDDNQLVIPIPIQENGGIEVWPDGFFDQTDKDFKILFGF